MKITNYAQLIRALLDFGAAHPNVNTAFEGDIYEINNFQNAVYPMFIVSPTEAQIEHENYWEYRLTFYYVMRVQDRNDQYHNADTALIYSDGMTVLSNIIGLLKNEEDILDIPGNINYTCWEDKEIFNDRCNGVYTTISILVSKTSTCAVEV